MRPNDLQQFRHEQGKTQKQLAGQLGVHLVTLARWELGMRPIPAWVAGLTEGPATNLRLLRRNARRRALRAAGKARWKGVSDEERSRLMSKAVRTRWARARTRPAAPRSQENEAPLLSQRQPNDQRRLSRSPSARRQRQGSSAVSHPHGRHETRPGKRGSKPAPEVYNCPSHSNRCDEKCDYQRRWYKEMFPKILKT